MSSSAEYKSIFAARYAAERVRHFLNDCRQNATAGINTQAAILITKTVKLKSLPDCGISIASEDSPPKNEAAALWSGLERVWLSAETRLKSIQAIYVFRTTKTSR